MMFIYDYFSQQYKWTPRQVDELTLEEMFWLPVLDSARQDAVRQLNNSD